MRWLRAIAALAVLLLVPANVPANAQSIIEILSKAEARQLFGLSRQQWEANVASAVASGVAVRRSSPGLIGMQYKAPGGDVITRLDYSRGEAKPLFVQIVVAYPPGQPQPALTETSTKEFIATARQQMAPEFNVDASVERAHGGTMILFMITEAARGPKGSR